MDCLDCMPKPGQGQMIQSATSPERTKQLAVLAVSKRRRQTCGARLSQDREHEGGLMANPPDYFNRLLKLDIGLAAIDHGSPLIRANSDPGIFAIGPGVIDGDFVAFHKTAHTR